MAYEPRSPREAVDSELAMWIESLRRESLGCLPRETVDMLYHASLESLRYGGEPPVDVEVEIALPNGLHALVPLGQLPEAWANILHIYCSHDYDRFPGFTPQKGWVVVDAGAYLGFYTLYASKLVGEEGLVVAVEPASWPRETLERNIKLNRLDNVRVAHYALWSTRTRLHLHIACYWANTSHPDYAQEPTGVCGVEEIEAVTLEQLLEEQGLDSVDLLKLDVEGAELEVLSSSTSLLKTGRIKRLVVEIHTRLINLENVASLLEEYGYHVETLQVSPEQWIAYATKTRPA